MFEKFGKCCTSAKVKNAWSYTFTPPRVSLLKVLKSLRGQL
jgi:hypothetical protein